jgi:uncharacterized protein
MDLNLEQAYDGPVDLSHRFVVPVERLQRPELLTLDPVDFTGRLVEEEPGFVLKAALAIHGAVACSRCLRSVPFGRTAEMTWTFAPSHLQPRDGANGTEGPEGEGREIGREDLDVVWYDELCFPFEPFVDEELQLEIPMKPLCSEGCRGLCPTCGADRNEAKDANAPCSCAPPEESRWQALKDLVPPKR